MFSNYQSVGADPTPVRFVVYINSYNLNYLFIFFYIPKRKIYSNRKCHEYFLISIRVSFGDPCKLYCAVNV